MRALLLITLVVVLATEAEARTIRNWPYADLAAASDVVAIVELASVRDSTEKLPEHGDPERFKAHVATLDVAWIIKGNRDLKQIELLYFGYAEPGMMESNGALFIAFSEPARQQYLVFLKQQDSKAIYVPVTGHYDASISVKIIQNDHFSRPPSK